MPENPTEYPAFSLDKQFKIELYFLSREDEGNYFFDKNQRTRQTARSKAYDLTTEDALSLLAKSVIQQSRSLNGNVNRVTDRLTASNPHVITLSTLREMMRSVVKDGIIDEEEIEGTASIVARFYDMLAGVRPELGIQAVQARRRIREDLLVDSAVMMHGYARLVADYVEDISKLGTSKAHQKWQAGLSRIRSDVEYRSDNFRGDLFSKNNPLWSRLGILKPNARGTGVSQVNNGATRSATARVLRAIVEANPPVTKITDLLVAAHG